MLCVAIISSQSPHADCLYTHTGAWCRVLLLVFSEANTAGSSPWWPHCIVCNSIYQINLFENQNWIKPSFTTNVREKLKALMQGLQQRGQEYTGPGTMRGHNNVGVDEMPMQFSSDWYLHSYIPSRDIFILEESVAWWWIKNILWCIHSVFIYLCCSVHEFHFLL